MPGCYQRWWWIIWILGAIESVPEIYAIAMVYLSSSCKQRWWWIVWTLGTIQSEPIWNMRIWNASCKQGWWWITRILGATSSCLLITGCPTIPNSPPSKCDYRLQTSMLVITAPAADPVWCDYSFNTSTRVWSQARLNVHNISANMDPVPLDRCWLLITRGEMADNTSGETPDWSLYDLIGERVWLDHQRGLISDYRSQPRLSKRTSGGKDMMIWWWCDDMMIGYHCSQEIIKRTSCGKAMIGRW